MLNFKNFSASYDLFGDGSMVLVDLPGHSPGLLGVYVTMSSGRRFLFSVDTFYFPEGLEERLPKSALMQSLVSESPEVGASIDRVYELMKSYPQLESVGSRDYRIPGRYDLALKYYT